MWKQCIRLCVNCGLNEIALISPDQFNWIPNLFIRKHSGQSQLYLMCALVFAFIYFFRFVRSFRLPRSKWFRLTFLWATHTHTRSWSYLLFPWMWLLQPRSCSKRQQSYLVDQYWFYFDANEIVQIQLHRIWVEYRLLNTGPDIRQQIAVRFNAEYN